jgi:hypothetical protein
MPERKYPVPGGGGREFFLSIITALRQEERTLGRGQGVLPQHNNCSVVRRKVPGGGDMESFISKINVPTSGGKATGEGAGSPSSAYYMFLR